MDVGELTSMYDGSFVFQHAKVHEYFLFIVKRDLDVRKYKLITITPYNLT